MKLKNCISPEEKDILLSICLVAYHLNRCLLEIKSTVGFHMDECLMTGEYQRFRVLAPNRCFVKKDTHTKNDSEIPFLEGMHKLVETCTNFVLKFT